MKRYLLFVLPLITLFSCVDSEFIVPGENIGNGDNPTDNPVEPVSNLLQEYDLSYPTDSFTKILKNEQGQITKIESMQSFDYRTYNFEYSESKLVSIKEASLNTNNTPITFSINYNDNDRVESISSSVDYLSTITMDYSNGTNGLISIENEIDSSIEFENDLYGFTISNDTETLELNLDFNNSNLTNFVVSDSSGIITESDLTFDDNINPVHQNLSDNFLEAYLIFQALRYQAEYDYNIGGGFYLNSVVYSENNPTRTDRFYTSDNFVVESDYTYDDLNYPINATLTNSFDISGTIVFTYY